MKSLFIRLTGVVMLLTAGPAFSGQAMHMWSCGLEDDVTEEAVEEAAADWLKGARQIDGGKNLEAMVLFPVAVNATGETDVMFVVTAPTFAEWGRFWDAYPSSDVAANEHEGMFCPDSVLWEVMKVK